MSRILPLHYDKLVRSITFSQTPSLLVERLANMLNTNAHVFQQTSRKRCSVRKENQPYGFAFSDDVPQQLQSRTLDI